MGRFPVLIYAFSNETVQKRVVRKQGISKAGLFNLETGLFSPEIGLFKKGVFKIAQLHTRAGFVVCRYSRCGRYGRCGGR
ncbi:hypothetical protein EO95_01125 [Methanosarcina sp. 1.H.T.1A.1]|nr:hypothetical protein EO95_01125 [Methanosarcina sp. 1.H.T.1A.1]